MLRLLAAFLLLQLLAQATGLVYAADVRACEDPASQPDSDDCTPDCEDCLCCPHHRLLVAQPETESTLLDTRAIVFRGPAALLTDPAPGEIMHVPRAGSCSPFVQRA